MQRASKWHWNNKWITHTIILFRYYCCINSHYTSEFYNKQWTVFDHDPQRSFLYILFFSNFSIRTYCETKRLWDIYTIPNTYLIGAFIHIDRLLCIWTERFRSYQDWNILRIVRPTYSDEFEKWFAVKYFAKIIWEVNRYDYTIVRSLRGLGRDVKLLNVCRKSHEEWAIVSRVLSNYFNHFKEISLNQRFEQNHSAEKLFKIQFCGIILMI